jgi:hypothetical protein
MNLSERDLDVLRNLASAIECFPSSDGWLTPMYCGGRDGSHHSATLAKLVRRGLAESKPRGGYARGSKLYRITKAGRLAATKEEKSE